MSDQALPLASISVVEFIHKVMEPTVIKIELFKGEDSPRLNGYNAGML